MGALLLTLPAAAVATGVLVGVTRVIAERWNLLDRPNERSSHVRPTPRLGGVAIFVVVTAGLALLAGSSLSVVTVAVVGAVVACISTLDDVRPLPAVVRLAVHLAAGIAVVWLVGVPERIRVGDDDVALSRTLALGLGVLWIAWFINAFNFMDGIDGLAAVQGTVAGAGWLILGLWFGGRDMVLMASLVVGASFGFLWHNWPPARIFMGDAGSAFLGFALAVMPWLGDTERLMLPGVLCVWPFVFDASYTLVRRAARGERVWTAHRSHLYQRLVIGGWSHARTTGLYGGLATLGVLAALLLAVAPGPWTVGGSVLVIGAGATGLVRLVHRVEEVSREMRQPHA